MICSKSKLRAELEKLKTTFQDNGYPEDVIISYTKEKIASFSAVQNSGPQKCPVYLKLPWIGNTFLRFESQIRQAITKCFFAVNLRIFTAQGEPFHPFKSIAFLPTKKVLLIMNLRASVTFAT